MSLRLILNTDADAYDPNDADAYDINDADADERAVKRCEREVAECGKRERGMPEILANFNNNNNNINNNNNSNNSNNNNNNNSSNLQTASFNPVPS